MDDTITFTAREQRTYRVFACCAAVPILLACAFLIWALPQLDPLGQGRANGAVMWPIGIALIALSLVCGVFQAYNHRSAGCLIVPLAILAAPCALFLVNIFTQW